MNMKNILRTKGALQGEKKKLSRKRLYENKDFALF
jgi:hypothetical protein